MTPFRIKCILRVLVLTANLYLLAALIPTHDYRVTTVSLTLLAIFQLISLIRFVESTNLHFARFLKSIQQSDFTQTPLSTEFGSSFDELKDAYNTALEAFRKTRSESEEKTRYLQMLVQHVRIGLIGFDQNGDIEIQNNAAKRLLNGEHLRHIDDIADISKELSDTIRDPNLKANTLVKYESEGNYRQLVINLSQLQLRKSFHTLVSMFDIQSELEEKEIEAWQNLIRVLTHEIMNSITPISSLAGTAHSIILEEIDGMQGTASEHLRKVATAVETINNRSCNLLTFVESYRQLTRIPNPEFQHVSLTKLFQNVQSLLQTQLQASEISFDWTIETGINQLTCDANLIEQVIINLATNSIHATAATDKACIQLHARRSETDRILISIEDNGCGIEKDVMDRIFIPFFTTKKEGSGIGLAFSRQVMLMHNGSIRVESELNRFTRFTLIF